MRMLLSIEGIDGCGKSTLFNHLKESLQDKDYISRDDVIQEIRNSNSMAVLKKNWDRQFPAFQNVKDLFFTNRRFNVDANTPIPMVHLRRFMPLDELIDKEEIDTQLQSAVKFFKVPRYYMESFFNDFTQRIRESVAYLLWYYNYLASPNDTVLIADRGLLTAIVEPASHLAYDIIQYCDTPDCEMSTVADWCLEATTCILNHNLHAFRSAYNTWTPSLLLHVPPEVAQKRIRQRNSQDPDLEISYLLRRIQCFMFVREDNKPKYVCWML